MGKIKNTNKILVGKPGGKWSHGIPVYSWEDIRTNIREIGWEVMDWIHLAQNRDWWGSCEHGNELSHTIKGGNFLTS
jgi:hypothetical protein